MSKLFVSNTTKQHWVFHYRVPERTQIMEAKIAVGATVSIYKDDMSSEELDAIVNQLVTIGAVDAKSVDRTREFIGLCYSVDKPPKDTAIHTAIEKNDDVLAKRGHELRKEAAVAVNDALSQNGSSPQELDFSIVEDRRRGEDGGDVLDEKIEVRREGQESKPRGRRKG